MAKRGVVTVYKKLLARGLFHASVILILIITIINLIGWISGIPMLGLSSDNMGYMKPITAICMASAATSLLFSVRHNPSPTQLLVSRILGYFIIIISIITFAHHFFENIYSFDSHYEHQGIINALFGDGNRMSVLSSILFIITGIDILCLTSGRNILISLAHFIIWPVVIVSYMIPVSHLFGVHVFPSIWNTQVTTFTIICFLLLSTAILFHRPNSWVMRIYTSNQTGSIIASRLMPGVIILPILIAIGRIYGERTGMFSSEVGVIIVATTYTVVFSILLWFVTRIVNRMDASRLRNEEKLIESEALMTSLIEGTPDCIYIKDSEGKYVLFNSATAALTGKNAAEVIGRDDNWLLGEEVAGVFRASDRSILETGQVKVSEEYFTDQFGQKRLFVTTKGPVFDSSGFVKGIFGMSHDITKLKKTEEALRKSEQRLKFHFENSPLAIIEWDNDFLVTQWSGEAARVFGWSAEETLGKRIDTLNMIYPEDMHIVAKTMERLMGSGEPVVVSSNRNVTKTGEIKTCTWYNSVMIDDTGKMNSVLSLVVDNTERLKKEEVLLYQATLLEKVSDAIILTDNEFRVTSWNHYAEKIYGFKESEVLGVKLSDRVPTIYNQGCSREQALTELKENGTWSGEVMQRRKDGSDIYVLASVTALHNTKGELIGTVAVNRDITNRKLAEEELRKSKDELETKVRERTLALRKSLVDLAVEQQRFRDVLDKLPAYVKLLSADMRIPFSNNIFRECFGDPKGEKCHVHMFHRDEPCENCGAIRVMSTNTPVTWEWEGPNGRIYQVSDFPFTDSDGTKLILEMGLDITEKKNFDKYLLSKIIETEESNRKRFASDLHDDLGPTLAMIKLHLELLNRPMSEAKRMETISTCESMLTGAIGKMRSIANNLLPRLIESYGLETALNSFLKTIPQAGDFSVQFKSNLKSHRLDVERELHLYRIICELINNTLRHSGATQANLNIMLINRRLTITYSDNGSGYNVGKILSLQGGMGLQNIMNRINLVNGSIDFRNKDGKTEVVIRCNLQTADKIGAG